MMSQRILLSREELYARVWDKPTAHFAAELGISDVAIGKICKKMEVPKPPRGYWARVEAGQKIKRPPLPKAHKSTIQHIAVYRPVEVELPSEVLELIRTEQSILVTPEPDYVVPSIKRIRDFLSTKEPSDSAMMEFPVGRGFLAISVSKSQLDRALSIMNALVIAFENRDYHITVSEDRYGEITRVTKDGEEVSIALSERMRKEMRELTDAEKRKPPYLLDDLELFVPTGSLELKVKQDYGQSQIWRDRKNEAIETRLDEIVAAIITSIEVKLLRKRQQEDDKLARAETIRRREEEEKRISLLTVNVSNWRKCEDIRAYLHAYESAIVELQGHPLDPSSDEMIWLIWANSYADSLDPLNTIRTRTE